MGLECLWFETREIEKEIWEMPTSTRALILVVSKGDIYLEGFCECEYDEPEEEDASMSLQMQGLIPHLHLESGGYGY
jgi:hypothetical protein